MALASGRPRRSGRGRGRRAWMASHPLESTCGLCDQPLGDDIIKTKRGWVHRLCHEKEHQ